MSLDVDQEILEDFLVEAGEILELLSEQLVDLEQRPDDRDLLNAIFRGFHTVKGGAGFLQLDPMVDCCHQAENLFDLLRNGEIKLTAALMDVVLQSLDAVNVMFDNVRNGEAPQPASNALLARLKAFVSGEVEDSAEPIAVSKPQTPPSSAKAEKPQTAALNPNSPNDEFDLLLGDVAGSSKTSSEAKVYDTEEDLITESEFEALLDELHGSGGAPGKLTDSVAAMSSDEEITEDEFEALLNDLQAKGEGAFAYVAPAPSTPSAKVSSELDAYIKDDYSSMSSGASEDTGSAKASVSVPSPVAQSKVVQESNVRVDTALLDKIMNMVGELVLVRNRLVRLGGAGDDEEMSKALGTLDMVTADLQTSVMKTRMQPVKKVFGRFPRLIRDLSRSLKKEIRLELRGEETDLDKNLVEALADPLIHLVRNSVDHGIESPEDREMMGKPREGHVLLSAEQEGDHILLIIRDDGAGMDAEKLRRLAVSRGMLDPEAAARLTDHECFNLIFQAGFSTKSEISDISGRGVGMDVVKTKITQLNGTLAIDSVLGQGTQIAIQVPLTLAIMPTLMVTLEEQAFALPLVNVNEIYNLDLTKTNIVDGQQVIIVRDRALPLFHLKRWLVKGREVADLPEQGHVVIVSVGTTRVGFVVDQLVGQEEVVIKPLGSILHGTQGLSGATITGDGRIALIIDIPNLLKRYAE